MLLCMHICVSAKFAGLPASAVKQGAGRGRGPEIIQKFHLRKWLISISLDSYGKSGAPFWPFLAEGCWGNIQWPLLLPAPLFFLLTAEQKGLERKLPVLKRQTFSDQNPNSPLELSDFTDWRFLSRICMIEQRRS